MPLHGAVEKAGVGSSPIHHPLMLKAATKEPFVRLQLTAMLRCVLHRNMAMSTPRSDARRSQNYAGAPRGRAGMFEFASGHFAEQKSDAYSDSDGDKRIALNALFEACFERHYLILSPLCRLS